VQRHDAQSWTDQDWQRLWLTLDRMPWRTLALIAAGEGAPRDFTLNLAVTLSRTGMSHVGAPIAVADCTEIPLSQLNAILADVRYCCDSGERVILALSAVAGSPTTVALAAAADGVVLCVMLGHMLSSDAKRTIAAIGPSKIFGSVIVRSDRVPTK
jgi:hypothetical protein